MELHSAGWPQICSPPVSVPECLDYWQEYHPQLNLALFHELGAADPTPKLFSTLILVNEHSQLLQKRRVEHPNIEKQERLAVV